MTCVRARSGSLTKTLFGSAGLLALLATGCASKQPMPTQQLTDVEGAARSANELGAERNPQAQLHLKLANDQLQQAKEALEDDESERAGRLLERAKVDAELAVVLTRESNAQDKAKKAVTDTNDVVKTSANPGATP
jgi:ATP adenylyltransferase/5',5'''-P-1,P-4-tetraphosphate phosphorylase II